MMGEVSMDVLPEVNENATNPYSVQFWREWGSEEYSGHALFAVFCFTVPILILNILTAFAIKVSVAQWDTQGVTKSYSISCSISNEIKAGLGLEDKRDPHVAQCIALHQLALITLLQDVEEVLRDAEINKLKTQADYVTFVEQSFLSR